MPPVFPGVQANTLPDLARALGLNADAFMATLDAYNAACRPGRFDHTTLDDCRTEGLGAGEDALGPSARHAALLRLCAEAGVTFTYLGLETDATAAVRFAGRASPNLFVAGEMMAGNVLGQGYTAGVGMSIGTAFGASPARRRPRGRDGSAACRRLTR
jgi:tricarballylate dehydrogenase